ncbi:alpha/beta fold hydrolase [Macrococcus animalis]|uniref:alpha/beta fold hydrolase n=1 Tax=Macrococcus animalis TaxID=3395467 RepID=UPI0039BDE680
MTTIDINGITLNYKIEGEGNPAYFFHGNGVDLTSHFELYDDIFYNYKRIYLDIPGMGESEADLGLNSTNDILDVVLEFIKEMTGEDKFILIGHSYGSYMCLGVMDRLQEQVKASFITCPVVEGQKHLRTIEKLNRQIDEKFEVIEDKDYYKDFLSMTVRINQETWELFRRLMVPGIKRANNRFMKNLRRQDNAFYQFRCEDNIQIHASTQVYVLLGQYDNVVGYKDQIRFFEPSDHIKTVILTNTGHNPMIDAYDEVRRLATEFVSICDHL